MNIKKLNEELEKLLESDIKSSLYQYDFIITKYDTMIPNLHYKIKGYEKTDFDKFLNDIETDPDVASLTWYGLQLNKGNNILQWYEEEPVTSEDLENCDLYISKEAFVTDELNDFISGLLVPFERYSQEQLETLPDFIELSRMLKTKDLREMSTMLKDNPDTLYKLVKKYNLANFTTVKLTKLEGIKK